MIPNTKNPFIDYFVVYLYIAIVVNPLRGLAWTESLAFRPLSDQKGIFQKHYIHLQYHPSLIHLYVYLWYPLCVVTSNLASFQILGTPPNSSLQHNIPCSFCIVLVLWNLLSQIQCFLFFLVTWWNIMLETTLIARYDTGKQGKYSGYFCICVRVN